MNVRPQIEEFAEQFHQPVPTVDNSDDIIHVSSATKRIAFAYERFRNTLEPDEEEILRRSAILRILERRLFEDRPPSAIATTLLQELIRGSYIKPCPRSYAHRIGLLLKKAKQVYSSLPAAQADWFLRLTAVGIDHELFSPQKQETLVHLMYHDTFQRTVWDDYFIAPDDRPTQLYLGCHRALFAADNSELAYHYFVHNFPSWSNEQLDSADVDEIVSQLGAFQATIEKSLNHPARDRLTRLLRPVAVPYLVLRDIIQNQGLDALQSDETLETAARDNYNHRARTTRSRMSRRAWHSILFLFMTKTLLAIFVEVPYEKIILGEVHLLALATNIAFHPLLLFVLATTVRMPGQTNRERVIDQLKRIITGEGELPTVIINAPRRYGATTWSVFAIFYAFLFMLIFWGLFSLLDHLEFSLLAMFFFVVFLGLVSFLATRIRRSVDTLRVVAKSETAASAVFSFMALPVLEFGRWLAQNIRQINVLLFFMDRILEAPFKILIDITEEWFDFVRDRREEIIK